MQKTLAGFLAAVLFLPAAAQAWGEKGHLMINRLAIDASAGQLPAFMRKAADHLSYNGFEPDRWREEAATPMNTAQAGEFNPEAPGAKGTDAIAGELARAATMLGNLWYTAWVESGEPIPQTPRP